MRVARSAKKWHGKRDGCFLHAVAAPRCDRVSDYTGTSMADEFGHRLLRAIGFAFAAGLGIHLLGLPVTVVFSAVFGVAILFLLNIITSFAATFSALACVFGFTAFAMGVTADQASLEKLKTVLAENLEIHAAAPLQAAAPLEAVGRNTDDSLTNKLSKLKEACDKQLMSKEECDAAKAKLIAGFTN